MGSAGFIQGSLGAAAVVRDDGMNSFAHGAPAYFAVAGKALRVLEKQRVVAGAAEILHEEMVRRKAVSLKYLNVWPKAKLLERCLRVKSDNIRRSVTIRTKW